jgi:hypothetical protein
VPWLDAEGKLNQPRIFLSIDDYQEIAGRARYKFTRLLEYKRVTIRLRQANALAAMHEKAFNACGVTAVISVYAHAEA